MSLQPHNSNLGSSLIKQATTIIKHANILTLPSERVVIAPSSDNKIIVPIAGCFLLNTLAGAYTAHDNSSWTFNIGNTTAVVSTPFLSKTILELAAINYQNVSFPTMALGAAASAFENTIIIPGFSAVSLDTIIGQSLSIGDSWSSHDDYEDGNALNTLVVSVAYMLFNVVTGLFESERE